MAFCSRCGTQIPDNAIQCPNCGQYVNQKAAPSDSSDIGWGILGFFVPIVGLVLYLGWKDEKPKTAKAAGMGALISAGIGFGFFILYLIFFVTLFGSIFRYM